MSSNAVQIPEINAKALFNTSASEHAENLSKLRQAAMDIGFMTVTDTDITPAQVEALLDMYRRFFKMPASIKAAVDMAQTGSNRGWGASGAEQVDPASNPDYKEVFDCGPELAPNDPLRLQTYYAPNLWPAQPAGFRDVVYAYYRQVIRVSLALLSAVARAIGEPADYFTDKFDKPMALLRGNYYPQRPLGAGQRDFGIAPHTDYGCLTLLATDGTAGLEVLTRQHAWVPVTASPGTFIINFGEMLQFWTGGRVLATRHRVVGSSAERLSAPFFFNPRFDANVAPIGSGSTLLAGDHLSRRYDETYTHRMSVTRPQHS